MTKFDAKKIMEMATYGRASLSESTQMQGDYSVDYSPTASGRDHNQVNQMGDNPLPLEEDSNDVTDDMLDHLHEILQNAGKSDSDIAMNNVKIKPTSAEKVVRTVAPGVEIADAPAFLDKMLAALAARLDPNTEQVNEFQEVPSDARFVHTIDTLGDVKITDSQTGKEIVLTGEDAMEVIGELELHGDSPEKVQEILSHYQHVMEDDESHPGTNMPSPAVQGLKGMEVDLKNMENKLKQMLDKAESTGDVVTATAANLFKEELDKLVTAIDDYVKQQS